MKRLITVLILGLASLSSAAAQDPERPKVTASEVVDRETLKAFVETGKEYLEGIRTLTETAKLRAIFRAEGDWKSGSTFLVILLKNGAVLLHGGDAAIDNEVLIDVEDGKGKKIVQELIAAAGRGGDFVEYYWDDPAVEGDANPKVSYAIEYISGLFGKPLVLVGGYYQDVSNVVTGIPKMARPAVTASEVVDRETLKTFVKAAAQIYRETMLDDYGQLSHVKNAFRTEGSDWKSGSVYTFIMSNDGYVLFHGTDPSREGRIALDFEDSYGVKVVRRIIDAAIAGGGYVEYHYNDPTVEGDEAFGSPKLTYAEGFRLPDGDQLFIICAGIYLDSPTAD
ncbi:MAG: cache domain-containing protein [Gemmatimonadetes bacterium]|nr:cache domain-containing protein [Gemmatimonadota bacterium]